MCIIKNAREWYPQKASSSPHYGLLKSLLTANLLLQLEQQAAVSALCICLRSKWLCVQVLCIVQASVCMCTFTHMCMHNCTCRRVWECQSIDELEETGESVPDPLGCSASAACLLLHSQHEWTELSSERHTCTTHTHKHTHKYIQNIHT